MSTSQFFIENLISCRNILLAGRPNKNLLTCIEDVLINLDAIQIETSRKIFTYCVFEVKKQIMEKDFWSAGMILNFIHNFPLDEESEQRWDSDHFFSIELPAFLEHFNEIKSSKKIVLYTCSQLAIRLIPIQESLECVRNGDVH